MPCSAPSSPGSSCGGGWADAAPLLESKLDAVGYGFFIPLFFVYSGMGLDLDSIAKAPLRLVLFFVLMVVVRGGCRRCWSTAACSPCASVPRPH